MRTSKHLTILLFALLALSPVFSQATFEVMVVKGDVKYRAAGSFQKTEVSVGDQLEVKGRVMMEKGATLRLKTPMGDEIDFKDHCYVNLEKLNDSDEKTDVRVKIYEGKIRCKVNKLKDKSSFQVATPVAVAGVRGTELYAMAEKSRSVIGVVSGRIEVRDTATGIPVLVSAGQAASVKADGTKNVVEAKTESKQNKQKKAKKEGDGGEDEQESDGDESGQEQEDQTESSIEEDFANLPIEDEIMLESGFEMEDLNTLGDEILEVTETVSNIIEETVEERQTIIEETLNSPGLKLNIENVTR